MRKTTYFHVNICMLNLFSPKYLILKLVSTLLFCCGMSLKIVISKYNILKILKYGNLIKYFELPYFQYFTQYMKFLLLKSFSAYWMIVISSPHLTCQKYFSKFFLFIFHFFACSQNCKNIFLKFFQSWTQTLQWLS